MLLFFSFSQWVTTCFFVFFFWVSEWVTTWALGYDRQTDKYCDYHVLPLLSTGDRAENGSLWNQTKYVLKHVLQMSLYLPSIQRLVWGTFLYALYHVVWRYLHASAPWAETLERKHVKNCNKYWCYSIGNTVVFLQPFL